jgi:hypothetical protein
MTKVNVEQKSIGAHHQIVCKSVTRWENEEEKKIEGKESRRVDVSG